MIAEPPQRKPRGLRYAHHMPTTWHSMVKCVQPPAWIHFGTGGRGKDDARGSDRRMHSSRSHYSQPHGTGGLISRTGDNGSTGGESRCSGSFFGNSAADFRRFE